MRISDWSSDVCSSDLRARRRSQATVTARGNGCLQSDSTCSPSGDASRGHSGVGWEAKKEPRTTATESLIFVDTPEANQLGRASCRERGCQYVYISVVAVPLNKNNKKK